MGDKFVKVEINTLANHCGYFNGQTDVNNGYGCDHPEQEETEDIELEDGRKVCQGKCLATTCPLGWLDYEDYDLAFINMSLADAKTLGLNESDYDEVLETKEASECKCCVCGKQAVAFWPVIDPDIPAEPYCRKCLDEAKHKLMMKLLAKSKI